MEASIHELERSGQVYAGHTLSDITDGIGLELPLVRDDFFSSSPTIFPECHPSNRCRPEVQLRRKLVAVDHVPNHARYEV